MNITANIPLLGGVFDVVFNGATIESVKPSRKKTDRQLGPALFDVQVNGYAGRSCRIGSESRRDALRWITRIMSEQGVGWWMPTVTTASKDALLNAFRFCAMALDEDPDTAASIPGFHLEGPYISALDGPRGAHPAEHTRHPDWDEFQRLQTAAGGRIKYVTLAPELPGAIDFIRKLVDSGIVAAMGHTNMTRDDMKAAVDAGATMCTHLGNGAHDLIQRHNNYIWSQLACRSCFASFISDGQHLPRDSFYSMLHAKGLDLSIITSDTVELGGLKPGIYRGIRGVDRELLPNGRVVMLGTPYLAGSSSNLRQCLVIAEEWGGISHADAWKLASMNPARMLDIDHKLGIASGKDATFAVYRYAPADHRQENSFPTIDILETWVAGKKVFDSRTSERAVIPDAPVEE
ncbi:MAG: amidohydrolase family protein [Planctomycetota bacterium]